MTKLLKWILAGVGVVVVLVVIAGVVLPMVIDPNNYKEEISTAVFEKTGRELTIGGEIKWTVFPSIGLELSDVSLGNRSDFGDEPMLDIGDVGVSVKLMPLFSRKLEVGEVSLSDVSIKLQRKADGQTNWGDFSGPPSKTATTSPGSMDFGSFVVSGVEINNANVTLEDVDQTTELKAFGLRASNIELGRPFDLKGGFSMNLPEQQLAGDVKFGGLVQSAANGTRYGVEQLELSFIGYKGPAGDTVSLELSITANADIDLANDKATLTDFVLQLHDLVVVGDLNVTSIMNDPEFAGQLKVNEFNPKSFMQALGLEEPQTSDANALTRLQADMSFAGSGSNANMRDLTVKFDQSTFKGNLKVDNFTQPRLAFNFQIDSLNVDDYLPGSGQEASGGDTAETDLTVETFRGFTGGGDFRIGELVVAGMKATEVSLTMSSNANGIRFFPVNAQFYGGQHEGEIRIDASGSRPILIADQGMTGVQTGGLLQDLTGSARLLGVGDFFLKVRTDLSNSRSVLQSLNGDIGMSVVDGAIVGIDVTKTLGTVNKLLGKQTEAEGKGGEDQKTEFAELSMTGVFDQGIMKSDDLMMLSPLLSMTGKGSFNLVEESIDYLLKPVLTGDTGVQGLDSLSGTTIPIRLTGNLYEPDYKVDIAAALIGSQKELIDQKTNEILGGLLGGKNSSETGSEEGESAEKKDPATSLLNGLLGGKKDKKKKKNKEDGGEGGAN
ncbi:AsmA family protein [Pseudomonadota bacterium]